MSTNPTNGTASMQLPELNETDYFLNVLQLSTDKSEAELDQELLDKAHNVGISASLPSLVQKNNTSSCLSDSTFGTYQDRTFSTDSERSANIFLTPASSIFGPPSPVLSPSEAGTGGKSVSFNCYEKYLGHLDPNFKQPTGRKGSWSPESSGHSVFSVSTRKSLSSVKSSWKSRMGFGKRSVHMFEPALSCISCRGDLSKATALHNLPCGHTYCAKCVRVMVNQATSDESKMPPRCCTQPIPVPILREVLDTDSQISFLKAVVQFSTPGKSRIFCPNVECGEFIPPRTQLDPKKPSAVACRKCETRVCVICKQQAHTIGNHCPEDLELKAMPKIGDELAWRRCYKCRNLVELTKDDAHVTCRCEAQFCGSCGGVWDLTIGCPNICSSEDEAQSEKDETAKNDMETARAAERMEAEIRSRDDPSMNRLQETQHAELSRFLGFKAVSLESMKTRHLEQRKALTERHLEQEEKMKEKHGKMTSQLEDRQIAAELELRSTLDQSERSIKVRLKHMEAYCNGLGRKPENGEEVPVREVTERDLRELGQQYSLRDGMERANQAKINVLRDRQSKAMEDLLDRQESELENLLDKREGEHEDLDSQISGEEDAAVALFKSRQVRLTARWNLAVEVMCKELEQRHNCKYALVPSPPWPADDIPKDTPTSGTVLAEDLIVEQC